MSETEANTPRGYYKLLKAIERNVGGPNDPSPQSAAVAQGVIVNNRTQAGYAGARTRSLIKRARANGHIFAFRDGDGTVRLCPATEPALRNLIAAENALDEPRTDLIEAAAEAMP